MVQFSLQLCLVKMGDSDSGVITIILLLCHLHFIGTIMLYIALFFNLLKAMIISKVTGFLILGILSSSDKQWSK